MRVYLFIEHYPNPYKPWIDTQIVQLLSAGHDVRIFAFDGYTSTIHDEVRQYNLIDRTGYIPSTLKALRRDGLPAARRLLGSPIRQVARVNAARHAVRGAKQQVMAAARALRLPDAPPDVCYIHNLVASAALTFLHNIYPGTRVCMYFHGGEVAGQPKVQGEADVFRSVDAVITSTRFAGAQAVERGCPSAKVAVVPLGFHLPSYQPSPSRGYKPDGIVRFVSVGRMSPEKGFVHALQAVKLLVDQGQRGFVYKLIGAGIQFEQMKAFVRDHQLESVVTLLGEKTRREVADELEAADVLILPSIVTEVWAETQATVVQEALLMGCLTLTTRAGGVPEANAPIMKRFDVPTADPPAIAARMREIMALDAAQIEQLADDGRHFARDRYDIVRLMDLIMQHAVGTLPPSDPARY